MKVADSISYESLYRVGWGLALSTQILLCQTGLGGKIIFRGKTSRSWT